MNFNFKKNLNTTFCCVKAKNLYLKDSVLLGITRPLKDDDYIIYRALRSKKWLYLLMFRKKADQFIPLQ